MLATSIRTWLLRSTRRRPARKRLPPTSLKAFATIKRKCLQIRVARRSKRSLLATHRCSTSDSRLNGTMLSSKKGSALLKEKSRERKSIMASQPVALVTGASSGIGQATAELLAAHGFTVFGTSRKPTQDKRSYPWLPLDVRSDDSVQAAVQSLLAQAGRIDLLVNNAGYVQFGP